ncbi:MAG: hypothetical protein LBJ95_02000, partial [Oscillospiraceae bacterium]|nr:hypothetical protein [Oscillospiraceae bacterium]
MRNASILHKINLQKNKFKYITRKCLDWKKAASKLLQNFKKTLSKANITRYSAESQLLPAAP